MADCCIERVNMAASTIGICNVAEDCAGTRNCTLVERVCGFLERYPAFQSGDKGVSPASVRKLVDL